MSRLKSRRAKTAAIVVPILICVTAILLVIHVMSSPAHAPIKYTGDSASSPVGQLDSMDNPYFSLLYNSNYKVQSEIPTNSGMIFYRLLQTLGGSMKLEIYLKKPVDKTVVLDPDYKIYQNNPKIYKLSNQIYRSEIVDIATRLSGGYEKDALWLHGDYLLTIKLSSTSQSSLDTNLKDILSTVAWHIN